MSLYLMKTQLNFTSIFQTKITPNLNISERVDLYQRFFKLRMCCFNAAKQNTVKLSFIISLLARKNS